MALETTYAYDFPDLFKSNMVDIWKEYRAKWGKANCPPDSEICTYQVGYLSYEIFWNFICSLDKNTRKYPLRGYILGSGAPGTPGVNP